MLTDFTMSSVTDTPICCWCWRGSLEGLYRMFEPMHTDILYRYVKLGMRSYEASLC